jgi:tetratricopeptide (TPR) repeat protein
MKNIYIILIFLIFVFILTVVTKNNKNKLLKELFNKAYVDNDEEAFYLLLNSPQAKILIDDFSLKMMKLNYLIAKNDTKEAFNLIDKIESKKINNSNAKAFFPLAIGFCAENKNDKATELLTIFETIANKSNDSELSLLYLDCKMVCDIYINEDTKLISGLEEILKNDFDNNAKSVYQYRLAKLYYVDGRLDEAKNMLVKAKENSNSKKAKEKINEILSGKWNLL